MRWMGWGWRDLCEAPAQLVADVVTWIEKDAAIAAERASLREAVQRRRGRK